jgi:hypothetical protein
VPDEAGVCAVGSSRERRTIERAVQRARAEHSGSIQTQMPNSPTGNRNSMAERWLGWFETPLFGWPIGIIGGLVGFFYTPVLAVCGLCILLGFHRAGVVRGLTKKVQTWSYITVFVVTFLACYGAAALIKHQLERTSIHVPTTGEIAKAVVAMLPQGGRITEHTEIITVPAKPQPPHTHLAFDSLFDHPSDTPISSPIKAGQKAGINFAYRNVGSSPASVERWGHILKVVPSSRETNNECRSLWKTIPLKLHGSVAQPTHGSFATEYITFTEDDAVRLNVVEGAALCGAMIVEWADEASVCSGKRLAKKRG